MEPMEMKPADFLNSEIRLAFCGLEHLIVFGFADTFFEKSGAVGLPLVVDVLAGRHAGLVSG